MENQLCKYSCVIVTAQNPDNLNECRDANNLAISRIHTWPADAL